MSVTKWSDDINELNKRNDNARFYQRFYQVYVYVPDNIIKVTILIGTTCLSVQRCLSLGTVESADTLVDWSIDWLIN